MSKEKPKSKPKPQAVPKAKRRLTNIEITTIMLGNKVVWQAPPETTPAEKKRKLKLHLKWLEMRKAGKTLKEIAVEHKKNNPTDQKVTADTIRMALKRLKALFEAQERAEQESRSRVHFTKIAPFIVIR